MRSEPSPVLSRDAWLKRPVGIDVDPSSQAASVSVWLIQVVYISA